MVSKGTGQFSKLNTKQAYFKPKYIITSACFALCFTFLLVSGGVVYDRDLLPNLQLLKESGKVFFLSPVLFLLISAVLYALFLILDSKKLPEYKFLPKLFCNPFAPALVIIIWCGIVYFSYFPGTWCYDIIEQNRMVTGVVELTKQHPPLHTLIWGICRLLETTFGGRFSAIVIYSIWQIICTSLVYGKITDTVRKVMRNDICVIMVFLFFLLNPTFTLFSFSPTKDVWCMIFYALAMTYVCEWIFLKEEKTRGEKTTDTKITAAKTALCLLLACLFRNNMIYALIPAVIVILVLCRKKGNTQKKILFLSVAVVIGFILVDKVLFGILGIPGPDLKEMLSVPIQQIGHAYTDHGDSFTEEEKALTDRYIGLENMPYFSPRISDPLKRNFKTEEVKKDVKTFVSFWMALGRKYPDSYFLAYISLYSPYWYPRSKPSDSYSGSPYVETNITDDSYYSFERSGYLPGINMVYEHFANESESILLSRSLSLWLTVLTLFFAVVLKRKNAVFVPLIGLLYMLTLFLGPVCLIRYALPVLAVVPLMIAGILTTNTTNGATTEP